MPQPHFSPIADRPGWFVSDTNGDYDSFMELAKRLNEARPPHTYFVCGMLPYARSPKLYRITTHDPLDVIREFEVGSHAEMSYGENANPAVLEQMALVHARNPIVPFFADSAGFKCTFEKPLTVEFGEFLDETIEEGAEAYLSGYEGYEEVGWLIGPLVIRDGFLHLWWD
jgi:hypothetical protein